MPRPSPAPPSCAALRVRVRACSRLITRGGLFAAAVARESIWALGPARVFVFRPAPLSKTIRRHRFAWPRLAAGHAWGAGRQGFFLGQTVQIACICLQLTSNNPKKALKHANPGQVNRVFLPRLSLQGRCIPWGALDVAISTTRLMACVAR